MEIDYKEIGRRIRIERKRQSLSQEQLAEKTGISVTHMSHIETANTKLSLPVLVTLANVLNVSADLLLCGKTVATKAIHHNKIAEVLSTCDERQISIIAEIIATSKSALDKHS
jgi:transcriptional regulator with XRE-family HTH domain